MDWAKTKRWLGVGIKSGGQLLIGGVENTYAKVWNLYDGESFDLSITSSRWGLGLGGSSGAIIVIGHGFTIPHELHGKSSNDWGISIAVTEKLISRNVFHSLEFAAYGLRAARALGTAKLSLETLGNLRNLSHTLFAGYETTKRSGLVVLDVPVAGVGLEVSAFLTRGTMYVSNSSYYYPGLSD